MKNQSVTWLLIIVILCFNIGFADVVGAPAEEISRIVIKYDSLSRKVGDSFSLPYSVQPQTADKKAVLWFSSNPTVATVNSAGKVTCKSVGETTIQVVSSNSIALASCQLNVVAKGSPVSQPKKPQTPANNPPAKPIAVENASLNHTQLELVEGNSQYLIATIYPANASNKAVEWLSTDQSVVDIDQSGLITARKPGNSTIYMTTKDGAKRAYCIVYVVPVIDEDKQDQNVAKADLPFEDIFPFQPQYNDIAYVYNNELMRGTSKTTFEPNTIVNRAMLAMVVYRISGEQEVFLNLKFNDVSPSAWYAKAVQWVNYVELMNGIGDNRFAPESQLTREQLATILFRYAKYRKSEANSFEDILYLADEEEISDWAYQAVKWAHRNKILTIEKGFIRPKAPATRLDVARALHAAMKNAFKN